MYYTVSVGNFSFSMYHVSRNTRRILRTIYNAEKKKKKKERTTKYVMKNLEKPYVENQSLN